MLALYIILGIAIAYALIRAKHDSFVNNGPWKTWALVEAILVDVSVSVLLVLAFGLPWWVGIFFALLFGFVFWIIFDCACGWHRARDILYIGETGWDKTARNTFYYGVPFWFFKNPRGLRYLLFKLFDCSIVLLGTISVLNHY